MSAQIKLDTGGSVWKVLVRPGDEVSEGQTLFIMEVMKMEVAYDAPHAGKIAILNISEGDVVEEGMVAAVLE
ncbi:MAG: acetyl-CoA carboxylase biotin carboxyl carrier protein subunit [Hyphomicrobiaceae bacterium]